MTFDDSHRLAKALPGVTKTTYRGRERALTVGGKAFALTWDIGRT